MIAKALKSTARTQLRSCKFVNRRRTLNISTPFRNTILTFRIFRIPIIQILIHRRPISRYTVRLILVIINYTFTPLTCYLLKLHQYILIESNLKQFKYHLGQCRDIAHIVPEKYKMRNQNHGYHYKARTRSVLVLRARCTQYCVRATHLHCQVLDI